MVDLTFTILFTSERRNYVKDSLAVKRMVDKYVSQSSLTVHADWGVNSPAFFS